MILGLSILDDRLLMALHKGDKAEPEYVTSLFGDGLPVDPEPGVIWSLAGEAATETFKLAEKVVLSIPASNNFLKRIELDGGTAKSNPNYLTWLAQVELPGEPAEFHYQFLPLRESFDKARVEMLFFATPAKALGRLLKALRPENDTREITVLPEQLGLVKTLEKSLAKDDIPQAGIVSLDKRGAAVVYVKDGRFYHGRYFPVTSGNKSDLATDIETYLLSRAEASESLPLVIAGFPADFKTNWSPVVPAFMGIHSLEFAGAWGVAENVAAGPK